MAGLSKEYTERGIDPGSLIWARTKGLTTHVVRLKEIIKRSVAALLPDCGGRSELPNA